jgi:hypothetical protein
MEPEEVDGPSVPVHWPPDPATELDRPVWLVLVVTLVLLITTGSRPGGETIAALVAVGVVLAIAVRWSVAPLAIAILLVVGVGLRAALQIHWGSDVMDVIAAAIRHVEFGQNPYGVGYTQSRPPGAPSLELTAGRWAITITAAAEGGQTASPCYSARPSP